MIVDKCEEQLEDLLPYVTSAKIGDCANAKVLESLGVSNFDICVVCIGDSFQDSRVFGGSRKGADCSSG